MAAGAVTNGRACFFLWGASAGVTLGDALTTDAVGAGGAACAVGWFDRHPAAASATTANPAATADCRIWHLLSRFGD
ncbi:MAG TPA: hypothetical protein VFH66_05850 [Mycobacteriales bacterium]|nr:hypothetical protein [Mycobacteriales bacterium]